MTTYRKKYGKYISAVVIAALLVTGVPLALNGFKLREARAVENSSEDEKRIAADISNMTGVEVEGILTLRKSGKSWNEILQKLKKDNPSSNKEETDRRSAALAASTIGEDYAEKLKKEGFTQEEIMEAKLLFERVQFQLQEVTSGTETENSVPKVEVGTIAEKNADKEDITPYTELAGKLESKTAVYLMLKLKKDLGSLEKVMDEYLLSLQLELNLEEYLIDKKAYEKQKEEKMAAANRQNLITQAKIEEMMLKKIQNDNSKNKTEVLPGNSTPGAADKPETKSPLPEVPMPEIKDVKPQNPLNEIMKEIQAVDPMRNGGK